MRIPIVTTLSIEKFFGGVINVAESLTKNVIFGKRSNGEVFATQRPVITIFDDASDTVADEIGRGIGYFRAPGAVYFVNNDTVYQGAYSSPLAANISSGTERVYFFQVGDYFVILDPENNEGWYCTTALPTTLLQITDLQFPPNQTPALQLAKGGAVINKTLFVYTTNGELWNSSVEDPTAWAGTDFINSEISPDKGVVAFTHNNHVVTVGEDLLEFFYWASNPTGSPLKVFAHI